MEKILKGLDKAQLLQRVGQPDEVRPTLEYLRPSGIV